jgi:hypothetical protein
MDIWCGRCGEPWDIDTLHDVAGDTGASFSDVRAAFGSVGCESLGGRCNADEVGGDRAAIADALGDLLGDDVDGLAAMLDDFGGRF